MQFGQYIYPAVAAAAMLRDSPHSHPESQYIDIAFDRVVNHGKCNL